MLYPSDVWSMYVSLMSGTLVNQLPQDFDVRFLEQIRFTGPRGFYGDFIKI